MNTSKSPPERKHRPSSLAMMLALVACLAMFFWAWRRATEATVASNLSTTIREGSPAERLQAILELQQVTPNEARAAVPALVATLHDPDQELRARSLEVLYYAVQGVDDPIVAATLANRLMPLVKDDDPVIRANAVGLLGTIYQYRDPAGARPQGVMSRSLEEVLLSTRKDADTEIRRVSVEALAAGMGDPQATVRMLIDAGNDKDDDVRALAATRLVTLASESSEAAVFAVRALRDPSSPVRNAARPCLNVQRFPVPTDVVPHLIQALQDGRLIDMRDQIMACLATIGTEAVEARAAVQSLLPENLLPIYMVESIRTLGAIAPESAEARAYIPTLIEQLRDPELDVRTRQLAVRALSTFVWDPMVLKELRAAANDPDPLVSRTAVQALEARRPPAASNIEARAR